MTASVKRYSGTVRSKLTLVSGAALVMCCLSVGVAAGEGWPAPPPPADSEDAQNLAKQLSNPIASIVSVPFQFNWDGRIGPERGTRSLLNIQPVVPFRLSPKWNLVGRFIIPMLSQPPLVAGGDGTFGMSDIVASAFFSPATPGGAIWGIGPVISMPVSSDPALGSGKWSAGPTFVVLRQRGPWTYGALLNHLWSFADSSADERPNVNQSLVQPFVAFATSSGVTYSINSEATANWEADNGEQWTVPVNVSVSKLTRFGPFPFQVGVGGGYWVEKADGGPDWRLRLSFTFILPKGT